MSLPPDVHHTRPSHGVGYFIAGGLLLLVGLGCVLLYAFGVPDLVADGSALGGLRGATVLAAGVGVGGGLLLVVLGIVRRIAAERRR